MRIYVNVEANFMLSCQLDHARIIFYQFIKVSRASSIVSTMSVERELAKLYQNRMQDLFLQISLPSKFVNCLNKREAKSSS